MIRNLVSYLGTGMLLVLLLVLGLIVGCADDDDPLDDADELRPITATPTAVADLPRDIEEDQIVIEDGEFDTDSFTAITGEPVILYFINRDDETYTFEVADLITPTEIAAAAETSVEFNIPTEGDYEGELRGPDGEEVDTIFFEVTGPGGT